ncbi:hypothetical protein JW698_00300 [Candidatus Wolfebacteria bacterium]|nr:hypothetical protein [Candidatus Wolfebacteria bacterium]
MKIKKKTAKEKIKELPEISNAMNSVLLLELAEKNCLTLQDFLETKNFKENSVRTTLWRLQKKRLIKKEEKSFQLTALGKEVVKALKDNMSVEKEWDGKWRIIMFDIPEKKRQHRNWLRFELYSLDYKLIQKSVFMGQQPIDDDINQEINDRGINDFIRFITVGDIDIDDDFLEEFENF